MSRQEEIDTFDGAKPRFSNRGKKRRSESTLSLRPELRPRGIPRALVLSTVEGSDRGVEWVDFEWALKKYKPPFGPRYVFLFSGHMIDAPGRKEERFPPDKEKIAAKAVAQKLDEIGAGKQDLGLCGGACGGDLLFAEACLQRGLHLEIRIPFDEPTFLKNSVTFADGNWRDRYYAVKNNKLTTLFVMPEELGPTLENANPYERNNLWQLYTALSMGPEKVRFICLWDGKGGDGPGGTKHMHDEVLKRSGLVYVLDTNILFK